MEPTQPVPSAPDDGSASILQEILTSVRSLKQDHAQLASAVDAINGRVNTLAGVKEVQDAATAESSAASTTSRFGHGRTPSESTISVDHAGLNGQSQSTSPPPRRSSTTSKIILTSYPGQAGVDPLPMDWGAKDPQTRGPVVVSRNPSTIRRRNAIGAHGGSYSIYYALAVASKNINTDHKPDFTNTDPAVSIGPFPAWSDRKKIVAMDPLGHLAPWLFKDTINNENVEIRPTIAVTRAHMYVCRSLESRVTNVLTYVLCIQEAAGARRKRSKGSSSARWKDLHK